MVKDSLWRILPGRTMASARNDVHQYQAYPGTVDILNVDFFCEIHSLGFHGS